MKERKRRNGIEVVAIVVLLIVSIFLVSFLSTHQFNSSEVRVKNFFIEEKNTFDVVHIGASEIYTSFSPEYIWKNYGVASYNLATDGAPMGVAKTQVMAAREEQNPKLIVISLNGSQYDDMRAEHEGYLRMWIDNMPQGKLRQEAIDEMVSKDKVAYTFKILKYHSNVVRFWDSLQLSIREAKAKVDKRFLTIRGMQGKANTDDARKLDNPVDMKTYNAKSDLGKKTEKQLNDLLEYLKENDIQNVIFVNMPKFYDQSNQKMLKTKTFVNKAIDKCESYGYKVYDFDKEVDAIGLDPRKDYYNSGHLNIFGQQKMSKYFYNMVTKEYNLTKENTQEMKKRWDENYDIYLKVFDWANHMIKENNEYKIKYDYDVVEHIINGTIQEREDSLIQKSKFNMKKKMEKDKIEEGMDE